MAESAIATAPVEALEYDSDSSDESAYSENQSRAQVEPTMDRKLLKEASIAFETDDMGKTRARILAAVETNGGYVSNEQESNYSYQTSTEMTVRVPTENFDKLMGMIEEGVEAFDQKSLSVRDVTEQFVDMEARVKTKKELEARYLQLLSRANTVKDILEVERQAGNLRTEIEAIEGRLRFLSDRVSMSTLKIRFYQATPGEVASESRLIQAFRDGWTGLVVFLVGLVRIWPFVLLLAVAGFFGLRFFRRRELRAQRVHTEDTESTRP